jgi:predicted RND superfamily exporter protein
LRAIVSGLAAASRRAPLVVVVVVLALTGVLGALAGQVETATGNEGFAPQGPEISAQERINDVFGGDTTESTMQVIVRQEGGDVITVEGLKAAMATEATIRASEVGDYLVERDQRPGVLHFLSGVEGAMAAQGLTIDQMTDDLVKQFYKASLDPDLSSPEQVAFLSGLVSADYDESTVSASGGLELAFVGTFPGEGEAAFNAQADAEQSMADDLKNIDTNLELRPFSFGLLLTGFDEFTSEVGRLFAFAFLVILVILLFVYWLSPGKEGSWFASVRRTVADMLVTLLTIVMAILMMQGLGYLFEQVGIIDAFSSVTQIVPILLIGLGVDYAIHLTSRYREEIGSGVSVDGSMTGAVTSVGVALFLSTITTVVGFLTNVFNPVPALKDFGILAAIGIVVAFLLMLTFVPAIRMLLDRRAERHGTLPVGSLQTHGERALPRLMEKLALLTEHAAIPTLVVAILLGAAGFYGFSQLDTRFSFTDFLPEDSPYVTTLDILTEDFGGGFGETTQVLVEPTADKAIDGDVHNALITANAELPQVADVSSFETGQGEVVNAVSPISILQRMFADGPAGAPPEVLAALQQVGIGQDLMAPAGADVTPLYQALLDSDPEEAGRVISVQDGEINALLWSITTTAGEDVTELRAGLDETFQPVNDLGASAIDTSDNIIGDAVVSKLTASQSRSLFITIGVAGLVLVISFLIESRRWFLGVITIAPVALVVLWTYGLMYATGIPFGPVTATIAALSIGIGVPFTIHIARRFQEDRRAHEDMDVAMRLTMKHTGGALAGSAFTTMAGFGVLISSSLVPFRQMGQVTVYAIGLSLIAAVLVLPSMLALWDGWHRRRGDHLIGSESEKK